MLRAEESVRITSIILSFVLDIELVPFWVVVFVVVVVGLIPSVVVIAEVFCHLFYGGEVEDRIMSSVLNDVLHDLPLLAWKPRCTRKSPDESRGPQAN